MKISDTLRQLRQANGLTQEQVAQQIGLTRQALSSYESGRTRPDVETLMRLAEIYGTDLESILYGQEPRLRALHRIRLTFGITAGLLALLTLVSSVLLWCGNRFFPLAEGQVSPEAWTVLQTRMKLDQAWTLTDQVILVGSALAFLLLLLLLVSRPGLLSWKTKAGYTAGLAAVLLAIPLPFGLTDPIFPLVNYLITPTLVIGRLAVFLALDLILEHFLKRKK